MKMKTIFVKPGTPLSSSTADEPILRVEDFPKDLQPLLSLIDESGNGVVEMDELKEALTMIADMKQAAKDGCIAISSLPKEIQPTLKIFDVDGDGSVAPTELVRAAELYRESKNQVKRLTKLAIMLILLLAFMLAAITGLVFMAVEASKDTSTDDYSGVQNVKGTDMPVATGTASEEGSLYDLVGQPGEVLKKVTVLNFYPESSPGEHFSYTITGYHATNTSVTFFSARGDTVTVTDTDMTIEAPDGTLKFSETQEQAGRRLLQYPDDVSVPIVAAVYSLPASVNVNNFINNGKCGHTIEREYPIGSPNARTQANALLQCLIETGCGDNAKPNCKRAAKARAEKILIANRSLQIREKQRRCFQTIKAQVDESPGAKARASKAMLQCLTTATCGHLTTQKVPAGSPQATALAAALSKCEKTAEDLRDRVINARTAQDANDDANDGATNCDNDWHWANKGESCTNFCETKGKTCNKDSEATMKSADNASIIKSVVSCARAKGGSPAGITPDEVDNALPVNSNWLNKNENVNRAAPFFNDDTGKMIFYSPDGLSPTCGQWFPGFVRLCACS